MRATRYLWIMFTLLFGSGALKLDAQEKDSVDKKTTYTLSALWSNNANYYGQVASESLPFGYVDLAVRTPIGWYISGGGYQLLKEGNFPSELHLGTGFEWEFGKRFSASIGYSRSFYAKQSPLLQASNPNSVSGEIGINHFLKTTLGADYNFGKDEDIFVNLENSKIIPLHSFTPKDVLYIKPTVTLTMGTTSFYKTYLEEQEHRLGLPDFLEDKIPTNNKTTTKETTVETTEFRLLSYNFQLPAIWQYGNSSFMLSYQLSVLAKKTSASMRRNNSFLTVGYFYQF